MAEVSRVRLSKLVSQLSPQPVSAESEYVANYRKKLVECKHELYKFIDKMNCNPVLIRLAWHDSGTYDRTIIQFPKCGGANGSIRFDKELKHGANAGLSKGIGYLKPFKDKYAEISWADLIQLASVTAIEHAGGPSIPIRFGRLDTETAVECAPEGNLPSANPPFPDGSDDAAIHLRRVFYRMGFNDREIVALSGAHTMGRAFKNRSATVDEGYGDKQATPFTHSSNRARADRKQGVGMPGGRSWTPHWLEFNHEYYQTGQMDKKTRDKLLSLSTDAVLFVDPSFKRSAELFGKFPSVFFAEYTRAHAKLSELGSKFRPEQGFYL